MTDQQIQLIQHNWKELLPDTQAIAAAFYTHLFEHHPAIRALFPTSHTLQLEKLGAMLEHIVYSLDRLDILVPQIQLMGMRHHRYQVHPEHYAPVGQALLKALSEQMGEHWTPTLEEAWLAAYTLIAKIMQSAISPSEGN